MHEILFALYIRILLVAGCCRYLLKAIHELQTLVDGLKAGFDRAVSNQSVQNSQ